MSYQVLARKWRPKLFEEVIGQDHIIRTLQNAINSQKLAHAYLFTGTRGVGKTSIARLFSKAIRCTNSQENANPCLKCSSCLEIDQGNSIDYIEIDGASHNSVENIRTLVENVNYLPVNGKYKIYVIDEVHMLSHSAFNALLKTLEEPPAHTLFIFATTDPQKLLGTVISRCQRYDFKNVSVDELEKHIFDIAQVEGIEFENKNIVRRLAELGQGSVRDSLSLLDQVLALNSEKKVSEQDFSFALGLASTSVMKDVMSYLFSGKTKDLSHLYQHLILENVEIKKFTNQLLDHIYDVLMTLNSEINEKKNTSLAEILGNDSFVNSEVLEDLSLAEIMWIYETLVKDFQWALSSFNPEKVVLIILQKISLRRTLLKKDDLSIKNLMSEKLKISHLPNNDSASAEESDLEREKNSLHKSREKSWEGFLHYLKGFAPATKTNLEHGNLLNPWNLSQSPFLVEVAFPESAIIFKEYIEQKDVFSKLVHYLSEYLGVEKSLIQLKFSIIDDHDKKKRSFKTKIEIEEEKKKTENDKKKDQILKNKYIQEAEKIFNSKIDKIILNDKN